MKKEKEREDRSVVMVLDFGLGKTIVILEAFGGRESERK